MDTLTHTPPLFLSPALPSELLQFVIDRCTYPTTLIICGDRAEFLSTLTQDLREQQQTPPRPADAEPDATPQQATVDPSHPSNPHPDPGLDSGLRHATQPATPPHPNRAEQTSPPSREIRHGGKPHPLLTAPLAQLAVTRHIRTVFIPTVTHLRAFLSSSSSKTGPPLLVVYGFLALHRGTSEWSVQGLGASAAALVEAGRRARLGVVVVEQQQQRQQQRPPVGLEQGGALLTKEALLEERVPVLSGSARRAGGGLQGTGWAGKTP
ncbi:8a0f07e9-1128-43eb-b98c-dbc46df36b2c [Thermothielavioides terrestris]|uniref:8a0f07e9-1128-43eb-b98c-dbc46df36b2c n=1 Tax=Thermothielavioides terrestris TaxID=2587410 RepID=A0A446BSH2_9PEZI|nr:8a0f07e9-1128-43eb-b98c-dbc46df36b2c [Thermothielavioides terrestris]